MWCAGVRSGAPAGDVQAARGVDAEAARPGGERLRLRLR